MCCIKVCNNGRKLLIINVYVPFEDGDDTTEEFLSQLSIIEYLIDQNADCSVILGGDFNVDFLRNRTHTTLLRNFCDDLKIVPTYQHPEYDVDYTCNFNMDRFCVLDHYVISELLFNSFVSSVRVRHDSDNLSDHDPLILTVSLPYKQLSVTRRPHRKRIVWYKATESDLNNCKQGRF